MTTTDPTRIAPNPSDSMLMTLARAAMAPEATLSETTWPRLDLNDTRQREFGDYELLEEIGRGGMGVVYRARQRSLDRDVAIKFIAAGIADSFNVARFLGEARAAARLLHPNIVPVHEVGSIDGVHYFSMPLIKGRTLASLLDDGTLAPAAAIALMLKLCDAIGYAHRLGLLHLDLKPANVLLDERDEPLVTDFGLARHMDAGGGVDAQEVSGTPSFMAPEQILIKQYRLTPATDLYALGAILYRCLAGVSPHGEGLPEELTQRAVAGRVRPLREIDPAVPPDLAAVAMKCLELMPKDRYASVAEFADDLRRVRDGLPVSVRTIGAIERAQRWFRREPRLAWTATFALAALVFGVAATTWQWRQAMIERDRAEIASDAGARLFAFRGEEGDRAADLIRWLRERLPGNEARQADALSIFARAASATDSDSSERLLYDIVEVVGADYREQMKAALLRSQHPDRYFYAALLDAADVVDDAQLARFESLLQSAIAAKPEDPLVWQVAAVQCPRERCLVPGAADTLVRLAPDNAYAWVLAASRSDSDGEFRGRIRQAAARTTYDDYVGALYDAYIGAVGAARVPVPPLMAQPLAILSQYDDVADAVALLEAGRGLQIASFQPLVAGCGVAVGSTPIHDERLRDDCLRVGVLMMRSKASLVSQMIGVALVRNLAKGTPLADEALAARRLYSYLGSQLAEMGRANRVRYGSRRFMQDMINDGEMAAMQRQVVFFGRPGIPSPGWQPASAISLLSSRERHDLMIALLHDTRTRIGRNDPAAALDRIAETESQVGIDFGPAWMRARVLALKAEAQTALGDFAAARATLDKAWSLAEGHSPDSEEVRLCAETYVALFRAWHRAEPNEGFEDLARNWATRAAQFREQAEALRATP